jgi:16S rRNA processing protein RimM
MIKIGKIVKPQGIKGEIKIVPEDKVERYLALKTVYIDSIKREISEITSRDNALYIKLKDVNDRTSAEMLRDKSVFVKDEELEVLDKNEYYFKDLIGSAVYDEKGNEIGELIDVEQYGAADVIYIRERNFIFSVPFIDSIFIKIMPQKIIVNREEYDNIKIN